MSICGAWMSFPSHSTISICQGTFWLVYGFGPDDCANTIVLRYRQDSIDRYGAVKERLQAQRLSFARGELAVELTGLEFGGITAFGVPEDQTVLVDTAVMARQRIVMGAGVHPRTLRVVPIP